MAVPRHFKWSSVVNDDQIPGSFPVTPQRECIKVIVGSQKAQFIVDKELICYWSPFFRACLSSDAFSEAINKEVYLPEDDPLSFGMVDKWTRTMGLKPDFNHMDRTWSSQWFLLPDPALAIGSKSDELSVLKTYMLVDKLMIERYSRYLALAIMHRHRKHKINADDFQQLPFNIFPLDPTILARYREGCQWVDSRPADEKHLSRVHWKMFDWWNLTL